MEKQALGIMLDMSRNAVMSMSSLKGFLVDMSKMGYNCLFLYTEDTYEMEEDPYFGYLRGKYSQYEMRELDDFASSLGIEIIPCIQTLAHLTRINKWAQHPMDTEDILMVDDEKTYELIDNMFKTLSKAFTTRRIHVGMDEAHMLGRGKHLDKYGYETVDAIMKRHLLKVCEIANKYGYEIMVWSDMYFRPWNNGRYYSEKKQIPKEYIDALPENVIPVYWDYYSSDPNRYENMFFNHAQLSEKTWFAGGAWTWGGFAPLNACSLKCSPPAIAAAKKHNVNNVFVTMWGDDGGECSRYAVLPTLFLIAEHVRGNTNEDLIKQKFEEFTSIAFDEFLLLDAPNSVALPDDSSIPVCPCKYMLYSDPFVGFLDSTVKLGEGQKYRIYAEQLHNVVKKSSKYGYVFETMAALCEVLEYKYELGVKTRDAYKANNKDELKRLAEEDYALTISRLRNFINTFERQWMIENKPYGFEVQHHRLGGLLYRLESCKRRLNEYLEGKVDDIPELEEDILVFNRSGTSIYYNEYISNYTSCIP